MRGCTLQTRDRLMGEPWATWVRVPQEAPRCRTDISIPPSRWLSGVSSWPPVSQFTLVSAESRDCPSLPRPEESGPPQMLTTPSPWVPSRTSKVPVEVLQPPHFAVHLVPHGLFQGLPLGRGSRQALVGLGEPLDFAFQLQEGDRRAEGRGEFPRRCVASGSPPQAQGTLPLSIRKAERGEDKRRWQNNAGGYSGTVRSTNGILEPANKGPCSCAQVPMLSEPRARFSGTGCLRLTRNNFPVPHGPERSIFPLFSFY